MVKCYGSVMNQIGFKWQPTVQSLVRFCDESSPLRITCNYFYLCILTSIFSSMIGKESVTFTEAASTFACPMQCLCDTEEKHVDCSNRQLKSVPAGLSHEVRSLDLSDNPLGILRSQAFVNFPFLETVTLKRCRISYVSDSAFKSVPRINQLNLEGNRLPHLDSKAFQNLPDLLELTLSNNNLTYLSPILLLHNTKLRVLYLQNNHLEHISNQTFRSLTSLLTLNLASNPFGKLEKGLFNSLRSLIDLNLANCQIRSLPNDSLLNQGYLQSLNLADNFLAVINTDALQSLSELQYINLSGNPVVCACENLAFRHWLNGSQARHMIWTSKSAAKCAEPKSFQGQTCHTVPMEVFYSSCDMPKIGAKKQNGNNKKIEEESPYKSKLGPLKYNEMMGWYTAATLSGMLVLFLICLVLDNLKQKFFKWRRERRQMKEKLSYTSGIDDSLRFHKTSNYSMDGMDSISMVVMNHRFHNSSFDSDKDTAVAYKSKSNVDVHVPFENHNSANCSRASSLRREFRERRPDSLPLPSTTTQRTYHFPTITINDMGSSQDTESLV